MSEPALDWGAAEVKAGKLTVPVSGDVPRGWRGTFEATARLLGGGDWGELRVKKQNITVEGLTPGSEDKLRHFLESVVQQANADNRPADDGDDHGDGEDRDEARDGDEPGDSPDAQMAEQFRSFAEGSQPAG
jgi:hypothetical protein